MRTQHCVHANSHANENDVYVEKREKKNRNQFNFGHWPGLIRVDVCVRFAQFTSSLPNTLHNNGLLWLNKICGLNQFNIFIYRRIFSHQLFWLFGAVLIHTTFI